MTDDDPFTEPPGPEPMRIQLTPERDLIRFTVGERGAWAMLMPGRGGHAILQREDGAPGLTTIHASAAVGLKKLPAGAYSFRSCSAKTWLANTLAIDAAHELEREQAWAAGADATPPPEETVLDLPGMAEARRAGEQLEERQKKRGFWIRSQRAAFGGRRR